MRTVFLVPRRDDGGHRDRLWALCRRRWETYLPDWPVVEGHHEGSDPFNRGLAINRAARLAGDWDVAVIIDSDVMVRRSQVMAAVARAAEGYVTWAHLRWRELSEYWTGRTLADKRIFGPEFEEVDLDVLTARTNPISWSCCIAVPRATFDDMGGFDERFRGWGYEDGAWESLVRGLYRWDRVTVVPVDAGRDGYRRPADVINLHHPRSAERIEEGRNLSTATDDYIRNGLLGRRYQIAVKRDHGLGDQVGEDAMDRELVETHVRNLKRSDARFVGEAVRRRMPEAAWRDWWPTLEELRDGAIAARSATPSDPITVVVTSGGTADTWRERSGYLRASLASLEEMVSGSIVQRVVYADWPDEVRPELEAIVHEHGFYVAGDGHHGHTRMRQRLWRYLAKHAMGELVFGTEDDFTYERAVDLDELAAVLRADPHLAQVALLRDRSYPDEREDPTTILGWPGPAFTPAGDNGTARLEHRLFWTNNPSLFRRSLTGRPWPATHEDPKTGRGPGSEVVFGRQLVADPRVRFAFWGDGTEQVRHIGRVRAGAGY